MNASLRTLLTGVVDYAGLFPPAKLPLDQAIRNYVRYRQEAEAWMLGRFVIPIMRLAELAAFHDELSALGKQVVFSVLARGGDDEAALRESSSVDRQSVQAFNTAPGSCFLADCVEMRGPFEAETARSGAATFHGTAVAFFYEIVFVPDWKARLVSTAETLAAFTARRPELPTGLKLRTGGLEAAAFPSVEQAAFVLHACREAGVPLKFTAGLHHPLRRYDAGVQTHMHGFINVFVAGVLAHARHLPEDALRAAIADEDAADFIFTDEGLRWRDVYASTDEIAAARRDFVTSFGSCSFDEPRDELRALGWL